MVSFFVNFDCCVTSVNKTVTINLSGVVFTIEEDAYQQLKEYLDKLKAFFVDYEDQQEIVTDIESRIAEKFQEQLKSEKREVVFSSDVDEVVAQIGTPQDFQAYEAENLDEQINENSGQNARNEENASFKKSGSRRLYRDKDDKIIGGVVGGLANYLAMDAAILRIIFAVLIIFGGVSVIIYLILWVALPKGKKEDFINSESSSPKDSSRLYRDGEDKIVAGVSTGIAAFLQIDPLIVRLLFIVSTFWGGAGILVYIILWIALPEAKTFLEKMEMSGKSANLANIEQAKKNSKASEEKIKSESTIMRILAIPVGIFEAILQLITKIFGSLGGLIRIFFGLLATLVSGGFLIAFLTTFGILLGIYAGLEVGDFPIPIYKITGSSATDILILISVFVFICIPFLVLLHLGIQALFRKLIFPSPILKSFLLVWLVCLAVMGFSAAITIPQFVSEGSYEKTYEYDLPESNTLYVEMSNYRNEYDVTRLRFQEHNLDKIIVKQVFESQGRNPTDAIENAQMVDLEMEFKDSTLILAEGIDFKENAIFRGQRVEIIIYLPSNVSFEMNKRAFRTLRNYISDPSNPVDNYRYWYHRRYWTDFVNQKLAIKDDIIFCKTCPKYQKKKFDKWNNEFHYLGEFDEVEASGNCKIFIQEDKDFQIVTPNENPENSFLMSVKDGKLIISRNDSSNTNDIAKININLPKIKSLKVSDGAFISIGNFELNDLDIELIDGDAALLNLDAENIEIDQTGNSNLTLTGEANSLDAKLLENSTLEAFGLKCRRVEIDTDNNSIAKVFANRNINARAKERSSIKYDGTDNINSNAENSADISKK